LLKDPRRNTKLWWIKKQTTYGGAMNYRKVARPFDTKKLVHVVLKARVGSQTRFTKSTKSIEALIHRATQRYQFRCHDLAVNTNHIHLLIYGKSRANLAKLLRFIAAEMGRVYKSILKQSGVRKTKSLWVARPFTRLVSWSRRSLQIVKKYIRKNRLEVLGFIAYQPRNHSLNVFLSKWNQQFSTA
jgi:REP element-mobilizing transposase RayT